MRIRVLLAAAGYTSLVVIAARQTFSGLAPLDLEPLAAIVAGAGATLLLVCFVVTLARLRLGAGASSV